MKKVAIIGRANVGKSTFFNRLVKNRLSITKSTPGVTRDRVISNVKWRDLEFELIDTGGLTFKATGIEKNIDEQAKIAIDEADMIFFLVDSSAPITVEDDRVAKLLKKANKDVVVILNKQDRLSKSPEAIYEFYKLGFDRMFSVSSEHNIGFDNLLKNIYSELKTEKREKIEEEVINIAIVGKPNVGKSSLVNSLIGNNRNIVSNLAGTTRDVVTSVVEREGTKFKILDTAGIRKKAKVNEDLEYYSVIRAIKAIREADVVLLMIDKLEGATAQDTKIAGLAKDARKPIILVLNKIDVEKMTEEDKKDLLNKFKFLHSPIVGISALTKKGILKLLDKVKDIHEENHKRVSTGRLNEVLQEIVLAHPHPMKKGKKVNIKYITQVDVAPPTFVLFSTNSSLIHFSYLRRIENALRYAFGFDGVEIRVKVKADKHK